MKVSGADGGQGGRVLLVEDDPAYGEYVRRVLTSAGFDVSRRPDAESALARVHAERWDLLITDIRLPGMTGLELLERVREAAPGLSVAVLTGYASVDYAVSALRGSAAEFLQKPVSGPELIARATELIEASRAAREEHATGTRAGSSVTAGDRGVLPRPRTAADPRAETPADGTRTHSAPSG
jgi:two-component system, NtrC family, response regulator AtoC